MKTILTTLMVLLLSVGYSQDLPEMLIDPVIFKNTMEIREYKMNPQDTNWVCFLEGHYECCDTVETVNYGTMLTNVGTGIAYYGRPCCDPGWSEDACHGHPHYEPGIQVQLDSFNHTTYQWDSVSKNAKLDYEMANQQKHPARYNQGPVIGYDSTGCPIRSHTLSVSGDLSWFTQYAPIDTIAARWASECISCYGHGCIDEFYIYPTQDYNSGNRAILPYFADYYGPRTEGNWNSIPKVNNFYRLRAWHTPLFAQRNLFPDTVEVVFYKQGKTIIHDTLPPSPPTCGPHNPDPTVIEVDVNTHVVSWDSTGSLKPILRYIACVAPGNSPHKSDLPIQLFESSGFNITCGQTSFQDVNVLLDRDLQRYGKRIPTAYNGGQFYYVYYIGTPQNFSAYSGLITYTR